MDINIFGSTGIIGTKTLKIINKFFPDIKVNLLCANNNVLKLINQANTFSPKYVFINNQKKIKLLKEKLNRKVIVLDFEELQHYLFNSKSDYSIMAISGYKSLNYFHAIIKNTKMLGLVNKELIVSSGHLFEKFNKKIYPLDSEHFSIYKFLKNFNNKLDIKKFILTASGGPFLGRSFFSLKNISFKEASNHPKWNMGYKNSIDSATLVNKCLELIEAHYLFNIEYENLDILIHPESKIHSIIEFKNYLYNLFYFHNDMEIPIYHFLNEKYNFNLSKKNYSFKTNERLEFLDIANSQFPIFKFFKTFDKKDPCNLIKFNIGNEYAVNFFKNNQIRYTDIYRIIVKITSFNLNYNLNTIKDVIDYHELLENKIHEKFKSFL